MTKTARKTLLCLIALFMAVYCGIALLGVNQDVAKAESTYDISILGTSLSDSNLTFDSSDNASVSGSITYSPDENKLTLNNFKFSGPRNAHVINVVSSTSTTLTVELIGDSEITITENTSSSPTASAFYASERGYIYFVGGGSFTVDNSAFDSSTAALQAGSKDIYVYNSQLIGKGYNTAIYYDYRIVAYGENASILATATDPESINVYGNLWIYPALARSGGYMYSNVNGQKVEVSYNIDGSNPSSTVSNDRGTYASYKYFHIAPVALTVLAYKPNEIGVYYNFTPSSLYYGDKITVTPEPGYVLTNIQYTNYTLQPKATLQPDGSYVLDTAKGDYDQYDTIKFWATYAEAKIINKTPSVGGDYVAPSAGAYNKVVTIIPTPNAGYYTDKVTVTSASGNPITVTGPNADGGYTFVMPKEEVSISVEFEQLVSYDVWVAGIQFDSRNLTIDREDNNAITGSATYDPTSNTLTLDNFSYSGADYYLYQSSYDSDYDKYYYDYASIYSAGDLNIVLNGENTLNCAITDEDSDKIYKYCRGIKVDGALTIGGGTLNATVEGNAIVANTLKIDNATLNSNSTSVNIYLAGDAIISNSKVFLKGGSPVIAINNHELEITNSTVVIQSEDSYYGLYYTSTINIDENSILEMSVSNCAIRNEITVNYSQNSVVYAGENKENAQLVAEPDSTTFAGKYVKIIPAYDVWVAGVQFNASNLTIDKNDNNAITGSATYDAENNILTLDNFSYTGTGYNYIGNNVLIYSTDIDMKIVLKGTNTLVGSVDVHVGIFIDNGSLTIAGSDEDNETASLELTVEDCCINVLGSLSIENVKLTTTTTDLRTGNSSPTEAIFTYGDISITNSDVTAIAGDSDGDGIIEFAYTTGIISSGDVTITDSNVNVAANAGGFYAENYMRITNSTFIVDGGTIGTHANTTIITNSTVIISGEIAVDTDTMYGGCFVVSNSNVELSAQEYVIYDWHYDTHIDDDRLYDITGHIIYGGEDKESATIVTEQADIFANKYLRFVPASKVTVNYGIDGVDNEEFMIENGTTISLESPVIDGYIFMGWYSESTFENTFDFSAPITEETIVYAKFVDFAGDIESINGKITSVQSSINALETNLANKADTATLTSNVSDLQSKIDDLTANYQSADSNQQAEINALKQQVSSLISDTISTLTARVGELESKLNNVDLTQIATNKAEIESNVTEITALKDFVNTVDDNYINNTELGNLKTALEDADSALANLISALTTRVDEIKDELDSAKQDVLDNAGNITVNADKISALTNNLTALQGVVDNLDDTFTNNSELATAIDGLKDELADADSALNDLISALTTRVDDIKDELDSAKQDVLDNANGISVNADKISTLTNTLGALQGVVDNLDDTFTNNSELATAISGLKGELENADSVLSGLISALTTRVDDIKDELDNAKQDVLDNANGISANANNIATLTNNLTALQGVVDGLDNTFINDTELATAIGSLKDDLIDADDALNDLISALTTRVDDVEDEIDSLVANKADVTYVNGKIEELKALIDALDAVKDNYLTADETLKADLIQKIGEAKESAVQSATDLVNNAKAELELAIDKKADVTTLNAKVDELTTAIETAQNIAKEYTDGKANELTTAIANAKGEAITAAEILVNNAKADLELAIDKKADVTTLNTKVDELTTAIETAQNIAKEYTDGKVGELTTAISNAKSEAITAAEILVNNAKAELELAIDKKVDVTTLNAKVDELTTAIETAQNIAKDYTDGKANELTTAIANAKSEAITAAEILVNNAKAELELAIDKKADVTTLNTKVDELTTAIETAQNIAKEYTDGKANELTTAITNAKSEAITAAEILVNNAKAELNSAIALKADTATVTAKFNQVESAIDVLEELIDDYVSADTALKEELTTLVTDTKAEIIELIVAGDKEIADALAEEIAKLRAEIEALKNTTNEDIKAAESNAQVVPTAIASVAILGDIALLGWFIIKRRIV